MARAGQGGGENGPDGWLDWSTGNDPKFPDPLGLHPYGLIAHEVNGVRVVGHHGTSAGCSAMLDIYPDLGYTVAVLSNYDPPAANRVGLHLRGVIASAAPPASPDR